MTQAWDAKHYPMVYLTARPHPFRAETRLWLEDEGFPTGPTITENGSEDAHVYKALWLDRMIKKFGWVVVAAYGNAETDIEAYSDAQIPKDHTFIIGELAGNEGTVAIPNDDFTAHIASFIAAQPDNQ